MRSRSSVRCEENPVRRSNLPRLGRCSDCGMRLVPAAGCRATANMKTVGVVLYTAFEALDVYGPVEMWGSVQDLRIVTIAEKAGPITSAQGTQTVARHTFEDCPSLDILLVPGGTGTLKELTNEKMLAFLREQSAKTELVTSVCSGSMLLAKAGVLDGHKATSNKKYFDMAIPQSDKSTGFRRRAGWRTASSLLPSGVLPGSIWRCTSSGGSTEKPKRARSPVGPSTPGMTIPTMTPLQNPKPTKTKTQ